MKKPWGGRFQQATAKIVEEFTESVSFDYRLWRHDIEGSIAHAKMLQKQGLLSKTESEELIKALQEIYKSIQAGEFRFFKELEDIHMNIEAELIKKIGVTGAKLHTARSRNDQIALDLRLFVREETKEIIRLIEQLKVLFIDIAKRHLDVVMPGYTHLQRAQPVLLSQHLLCYVHMLSRDIERFKDSLKRVNVLPLGACALAGTSLPIDRRYVAKLLGFETVSDNSMDAVSDRDFVIEFISNASILMMHLSRLAEELVLWSTTEFGFIEISDAFTTGSSIMPQKKNPDVAELIRGKTGRIYGNLMNILTIMKALPLTYNRDLQEDKIPLFDTVDTIKLTLKVLIEMMPEVNFKVQRMSAVAGEGFATATDVAEYLVKKGIAFRVAHEITGKLVQYCIKGKKNLQDLTLEEFKGFSEAFDRDIFKYLTPQSSIALRQSTGSASVKEVKRQISNLQKRLKGTKDKRQKGLPPLK